MRKLHIALSTHRIEESVADYTVRLGKGPCVVVAGEFALWRTETLNLSIRRDSAVDPGALRHVGWEDPDAAGFSSETDVNGIEWERFSAADQADEINALWPDSDYTPERI